MKYTGTEITFAEVPDEITLCINISNCSYSKARQIEASTFISTIGKGIYLTKYSTYCVRLRRKLEKVNKNFKTYTEAVEFKKKRDIKYLELLLNNYDLPVNTKNVIRKYVEVFKYPSNLQ